MTAFRARAANTERSDRLVALAIGVAIVGSALFLWHRSGIGAGLGALAAESAALLLLTDARLALGAFLVLGVLAEDDPTWGINLSHVYDHGTAQPSPFQGLELLAIVAALLYLSSSRLEPRSPRPFGPAFVLVLAALTAGLIQGLSAGVSGPSALLGTSETVLPLVLVPLAVVNVVRTPQQLRRALAVIAGLAVFKALAGLFVYFSGLAAVQGSFGRITYFQAPANLLMMLFVLAVLVARLSGTKLPRAVNWTTPLVVLALVLSYRRTIWLGTAVALPLLIFVASGRVGRRFVVPSLAAIAIVAYVVLSTGIGGGLQGSLVTRAESISLSRISQSEQDRYRIDERHNVWAAIERSPLTGLGVGVPWPVRYPVGIEFTDQNEFSHIGAYFWWLKMGLLGLAAYVCLLGSAAFAGWRVWRRHHDEHVRVFGLACVGLTIGLAVIELANTVVGASERGGAMFGAMIGLLAVAYAQLGAQPAVPSGITLSSG